MSSKYEWIHDERIYNYLRYACKQCVKRWEVREYDREDLEQDCWVHLLKISDQYDPERSQPITYAKTVIDNFILQSMRNRRALKRKPELRVFYQSEYMKGPTSASSVPVELLMDNDSNRRRHGIIETDPQAELERKDYVEHIIENTSHDELETMLEVSRSSIKQTAEWRGVSRHQIRSIREHIRRDFLRPE